MKLIASDPVLPDAVKQQGRPAATIRDKVAQMANNGEPSHVNANSHTTNDKCAESACMPNPTVLVNFRSPI